MEIQTLTNKIVDWANHVFPNRTSSSALLKLFEEVGELVQSPNSPGEYADICIILFDLAKMHGVDLSVAIQEKMRINEGRSWKFTDTGTMHHCEIEDDCGCISSTAYDAADYDRLHGRPKEENFCCHRCADWYNQAWEMWTQNDD